MRLLSEHRCVCLFVFAFLYILTSCSPSQEPLNENESTSKAKLTGSWYSPEWRYGFRIEENQGYVTSWENTYDPEDPTAEGDVVLNITEFLENGFKGVQKFYDGSRIQVVAQIIDENTIELSGRREIWRMYRGSREKE